MKKNSGILQGSGTKEIIILCHGWCSSKEFKTMVSLVAKLEIKKKLELVLSLWLLWKWMCGQLLGIFLLEWLESKFSRFVVSVSWWRSLSLILIIVIIDILLILYVKVFIKLGNTPFEHFSRYCYIISKSSNLTILYLDLSMIYWAKDLKVRFGCIYYDMSSEIWRNAVLRYTLLGIFDINMRSIWIWILLVIYKLEKLKRRIWLYVFS